VNLVVLRLLDALIPSVTSADRILKDQMKWQQRELQKQCRIRRQSKLDSVASNSRGRSYTSASDNLDEHVSDLMHAGELVNGHCFYEADIEPATKTSAAREAGVRIHKR